MTRLGIAALVVGCHEPLPVDPCGGREAVAAYRDADGDGHGDPIGLLEACEGDPLVAAVGDDCDDSDPAVHPGARDRCDDVDQDCDGYLAMPGQVQAFPDVDGDGHGTDYGWQWACAIEAGWSAVGDDCDDRDPAAHPGAGEVCDGVDDDCDGGVDEGLNFWFVDADGDGYGEVRSPTCFATGLVTAPGDCDDGDASVNPAAVEQCDGRDQDCDGAADDGLTADYHPDLDGDGFGAPDPVTSACEPPDGQVLDGTDCNDLDATAFPGGPEVCDGVDDDCDGFADDGLPQRWFADADGDGSGDPWLALDGCAGPPGWIAVSGDCDDQDPTVPPSCPTRLPGDWPTLGNHPSRDSYQPGTVGVGALTFDWSVDLAGTSSLAVVQGVIYTTVSGYPDALVALDLATGDTVWERELADSYQTSGPTWIDGLLCVDLNGLGSSEVRCYDAATGDEQWSTPITMQFELYLAPLAVDGVLYAGGGLNGGLYAHDLQTGAESWFTALPQRDRWAASAWDGTVYAWYADQVSALDGSTGAVAWSWGTFSGFGTGSWGVTSPWGLVVGTYGGDLVALDARTGAQRWITSPGANVPALANGALFATDPFGDAKRFDLETGALQATVSGDGKLAGTPVVTDDAVIVSSPNNTYVYGVAGGLLQHVADGGQPIVAEDHLVLSDASGIRVWSW